jgi:hypothetical protein
MMRWCRLVCDYEQRADVSEELMHATMGSLILQRLSDQN